MLLSSRAPKLSIIVIFHNMRREAKRTLFSMSSAYQSGVDQDDWEVHAIDNGSDEPLNDAEVSKFGRNFFYHYHPTEATSPVEAINLGVKRARGKFVSICIDGARILTPGIIRLTLDAFAANAQRFVCTLAWHLGPKLQNLSMLEGYDQSVEDELLAKTDWRNDGYKLFEISVLAGSSGGGFFSRLSESNFFSLPKAVFLREDGFDLRFSAPGGGSANLDFYKRIAELRDMQLVHLLGEGSFHQFHGGIATNVPLEQHPKIANQAQYEAIRGKPFSRPEVDALYLGHMPPAALKFIKKWDA